MTAIIDERVRCSLAISVHYHLYFKLLRDVNSCSTSHKTVVKVNIYAAWCDT